MTLSEIIDRAFGSYGMRYSIDESRIAELVDILQKLALDADLDYMLEWDEDLELAKELSFDSSGYTDAILSDVGLTDVTGGTSGAIGKLIRYDNENKKWGVVVTSGEFVDGEPITIGSGTGAGTLLSSSAVDDFYGPYYFPSAPPCRRLVGVHSLTDDQLFQSNYWNSVSDYGFETITYPDRHWLHQVRRMDIPKLTDVTKNSDSGKRWVRFKPSFNFADNARYRWLYYRRAPDIDINDENSLIIPSEYHNTVVLEGVRILGQADVQGVPATDEVMEKIVGPMRLRLQKIREGNGHPQNQVSEGQM